MNYQEKIATSRIERTAKFVGTGAKIGGNYIKHYVKKALDKDYDPNELHADNAGDIYQTLSELKGSALKVAQMLSMDKGMLPKEYTDKFTMAQYQAPPLSAPLVVKTITSELGRKPHELFENFSPNSVNAASMGQVHSAELNGKQIAIKVQYPGVADSIKSDLKIVKPIALRMFGLSERDLNKYIAEVEEKLMEETDYTLELRRSMQMAELCNHLDNVAFPSYYPEFSSPRVITMDWLPGQHLNEFLKTNPAQEVRDKIGQALWNFFDYQMHDLKMVHADPHPGNFLFRPDGTVGIIDFGCIKEVPHDFYLDYFALIMPEIQANEAVSERIMERIEMIYASDDDAKRKVFKDLFLKMTRLLSMPFREARFHFGDPAYMERIYALGEEINNNPVVKNTRDGRGSRHMLYINRTYFGLYSILHSLGATISVGSRSWRETLLRHHQMETAMEVAR